MNVVDVKSLYCADDALWYLDRLQCNPDENPCDGGKGRGKIEEYQRGLVILEVRPCHCVSFHVHDIRNHVSPLYETTLAAARPPVDDRIEPTCKSLREKLGVRVRPGERPSVVGIVGAIFCCALRKQPQ